MGGLIKNQLKEYTDLETINKTLINETSWLKGTTLIHFVWMFLRFWTPLRGEKSHVMKTKTKRRKILTLNWKIIKPMFSVISVFLSVQLACAMWQLITGTGPFAELLVMFESWK